MALPKSISTSLPAPRWQTPLPPNIAGSWGPAVAEYARTVLGIDLDRWQQRAVNRALATDAEGRLLHRMYLISTARQNGKTALVRALIGWALTNRHGPPWESIAGVAYDKKQARIPYKAVLADLRPLSKRLSKSQLSLTMYLGIRSNMHGRRERVYDIFGKEARDQIRGESNDLAIFDEVRTQRNYELWSALEPTTTARDQPLILPISTAGDERSVLLRDWWERGLRVIDGAEEPRGFGMTWYAAGEEEAAAAEGSPEFLRGLYQANPSLAEGRLSLDAILSGVANSTGPAMVHAERLNLWTDAADEWLPPGLWAASVGPQPVNLEGVRITLGVEAVPSWRRATVTVAIQHDAGTWAGVAGELDSTMTDSSSIEPKDLQAMLERLCQQWRPTMIAVSGSAAAAPYATAAGLATGVSVAALTPRQIRNASQLLRSELIGHRLKHTDDLLLGQQVRAARPSGAIEGADWYLSIRDSLGEIDAIRALAWAAYAAIAPPDIEEPPQVFF